MVRKLIIVVTILVVSLFSCKADLPYTFLHAISTVESNNDPNKLGDYYDHRAFARGLYQIHPSCFSDCKSFDSRLKKFHWRDCSRVDISNIVINDYLSHYAKSAYNSLNYCVLCHVWNSGNYLRHPHASDAYWLKVKKVMDEEKN